MSHASPRPLSVSLSAAAVAVLLSACASSPLPPVSSSVAQSPGATGAAPQTGTGPGSGSAVRPDGAAGASSLPPGGAGQATNAATARPDPASVFFDFDDYALDGTGSTLVERYGRHLRAVPSAQLRVEGHADERGGREYNLALGHKRAQAVVSALRIHGVSPAAVEAISYGKERPRALGQDEASWAQNRRADLVLR